jgi:hypothetical protein
MPEQSGDVAVNLVQRTVKPMVNFGALWEKVKVLTFSKGCGMLSGSRCVRLRDAAMQYSGFEKFPPEPVSFKVVVL